jgi:hypothetical protein
VAKQTGGRIILAFVLLQVAQIRLYAQCDGNVGPDGLSWNFDIEDDEKFSLGRFLSDIFTPQIVIDTKKIRAYIRDARFRELTKRCGDMRSIDGIYLKALKIADYNISRALFLSMMAVLEHRKVEIKMPLVNSLPVPLTFEEDSLFQMRIRNLPTRVYPDSPDNEEGDRDKLQHFFASAYLSYISESPEMARTAGNLVEWGEAQFVVGGVDDPRDKRANKHGESFGRDLISVKTLLPSDYLTLPYEEPEN